MDLIEIGWGGVVQDRDKWGALKKALMKLWVL
jgi:hypothetical protein